MGGKVILKNEKTPAPWDPSSFGFYWGDFTVQFRGGPRFTGPKAEFEDK